MVNVSKYTVHPMDPLGYEGWWANHGALTKSTKCTPGLHMCQTATSSYRIYSAYMEVSQNGGTQQQLVFPCSGECLMTEDDTPVSNESALFFSNLLIVSFT